MELKKAKVMNNVLGTIMLFGFAVVGNGCAFKYYDAEQGTEHLWGFGHFRMKAPPRSSDHAFVTGSQMFGVNLRAGREDCGLSVGYDSHSRVTMPTEGTLYFEWPTNAGPAPRAMRDFFTVRIGTNLPPLLDNANHLNSDKIP